MLNDLLKLGAVFGLVAINGLFVAAEFALVSARKTRIDQLALDGNRMAKVVQRAQADPNRFISAAQVGITMASLALGWIAEPALASLIDPLFTFVLGANSVISVHLVAGILAYFIITLLHIVLGEQVPKMIALQKSEATILATAGPVAWISIPFKPMISLLYWLTTLTLRPLKLEWKGQHHLVYSEDELKMLVTASHQSGFLEQSEQEIINRVFGFADLLTEQVMVPRTEMIAFQVDMPLNEITHVISIAGHARYAVYGENLDDILGIFFAKDLYRFLDLEEKPSFALRRLMRVPLMVPDTMPLDDLLTQMKRQRTHIAIVVDEYGGTAGMVTLEDILERIVGDVQDEFENQGDDVQRLDNGDVRISGLLSIEDVSELFELNIEDPFYNTIGGFVFGQLGRRPDVGDEVEIDGHSLRVDLLDGLRIDRLLLIKNRDEPNTDPDDLQLESVEG